MTVLKLESFSHDVEIRKGISKFESFDALRVNAYNDGVKSGAEAATRAFETEKIRTLAPILEALNDITFSQIEAQRAVLKSVQPMLEQLLNAIFPQLASQGFATEVAALVETAYKKAPQAKIIISVTPDAVSSIEAALAPAKADYAIEPDPNLGGLEATVSWQGGYDQINLDATLSEVRTIIHDFFSNLEQTGTQNA